jgi:hypothetical protein
MTLRFGQVTVITLGWLVAIAGRQTLRSASWFSAANT